MDKKHKSLILLRKSRLVILFFICFLAYSQINCMYSHVASAYESKKITLDIKGMDVLDVLKMISKQADINIIAGKNVTGRVTMFLKDVDAWEAFQIIILANDLAYEQEGKIINVMTARDYELKYGDRFAEKKQLLSLPLKHAKAAIFAQVLNQIKSKIGSVTVDDPSNTLIIIDTPEKLKQIKQIHLKKCLSRLLKKNLRRM